MFGTLKEWVCKQMGWVSGAERAGKEIDYEQARSFDKIHDKARFLEWLINLVPDGTTWSIEGIYDSHAIAILEKYPASDSVKTMKATAWPRQSTLKVRLDAISKKEIVGHLKQFDFEGDFIHQHFNFENDFYLTAFDNLEEGCTFIWKGIGEPKLSELEREGIAVLSKE